MSTRKSIQRLVLTDIENFAGQTPRNLSNRDVERLAGAVRGFLEIDRADEVVVACNPRWAPPVQAAWAGCQLLVRGGRDGADKELVQHAKPARIAEHESLWIVGGDWRLAKPARIAKSMGLRVVVVAIESCLSRDLRGIADRIIPFSLRPLGEALELAA